MATIHGNHDTRQPYTSNDNDGNDGNQYQQRHATRYTSNRNGNDTLRATVYIYVSCIHGNHDTLHATRATATVAVWRYTTTIYTTLSAVYMATATTRHEQPQPCICQLRTWQRRQPQPQPQPLPRGKTPRFDRVFIPYCARKLLFTTRKKMTNPHHMTGIV
jgi:hypothetical protein